MDINKIMSAVDHTILSLTATAADVLHACDEAMEYGVAGICVPPCYVRDAAAHVNGRLPVCTVVGFPMGNTPTNVKLFEASAAVQAGASEVDMVVNLGRFKAGRLDLVAGEIRRMKLMVGEGVVLKVIAEAGLLSPEEAISMLGLAKEAGADFIATSTGLNPDARDRDTALFAAHADGLRIKAACEIADLEDAQRLLDLGAARLGSGAVIALLRKQGVKGINAPDRFSINTI